jgi:hypothetical protein
MNKVRINEKGFSILEGLLIFVVIAVIVVVGGVVYFFHSINSLCGPRSPNHKTEVSKVQVFNGVNVVPGQPNASASIYDSTQGTCNIDVAQSYSATKSYTVSLNGATALSAVTDSLQKQGFSLTKDVFSEDSCSTITGKANYSGKSIVITVDFGEPTSQCQNQNPNNIHPDVG